MITILFGIICSTGILVLFKLLSQSDANTQHAIFLSYAVSAIFGFLILSASFSDFQSIWVLAAGVEGIAFYCVFHLIARSASLSGVAFTSVASKMSVIIPIAIGLTFLGDSGNLFVFSGVLLGLLAVLLTIGDSLNTKSWIWPILVFLGTGAIDASFKLFQVWGLTETNFPAFIVCIFSFAFLTGLSRYCFTTRERITAPSLLAGLGLGLLNLGTVYFLMKALAIPSFDSTVVYALNSFGIVLASMLVATAIFRESVSKRAYVGIAMAFASIASIYLSHAR